MICCCNEIVGHGIYLQPPFKGLFYIVFSFLCWDWYQRFLVWHMILCYTSAWWLILDYLHILSFCSVVDYLLLLSFCSVVERISNLDCFRHWGLVCPTLLFYCPGSDIRGYSAWFCYRALLFCVLFYPGPELGFSAICWDSVLFLWTASDDLCPCFWWGRPIMGLPTLEWTMVLLDFRGVGRQRPTKF